MKEWMVKDPGLCRPEEGGVRGCRDKVGGGGSGRVIRGVAGIFNFVAWGYVGGGRGYDGRIPVVFLWGQDGRKEAKPLVSGRPWSRLWRCFAGLLRTVYICGRTFLFSGSEEGEYVLLTDGGAG